MEQKRVVDATYRDDVDISLTVSSGKLCVSDGVGRSRGEGKVRPEAAEKYC